MEEGLKGTGHIWASYAEPCVFDCGTGYSARALREECDKRNEDWLDEPKYEREGRPMELIKAIHVDDLKEIQEEAERYLFNRSVPDVLLSGLEDGIEWLPVSFSMNHTRMKLPGDPDFDEPHVRVLVVYSRDGKKAQLDITTKRFNKLQTVGVSTPDDGEVKDAT